MSDKSTDPTPAEIPANAADATRQAPAAPDDGSLQDADLENVAGGVDGGEDGKGCTEWGWKKW